MPFVRPIEVGGLVRLRVEMRENRVHDLFYPADGWAAELPPGEWAKAQMERPLEASVAFPPDKDGYVLVVSRADLAAILVGPPRVQGR